MTVPLSVEVVRDSDTYMCVPFPAQSSRLSDWLDHSCSQPRVCSRSQTHICKEKRVRQGSDKGRLM